MKKLFLLPLFLSACAPGLIYTDIKEPLFSNITAAPVTDSAVKGASYEIKEPFSAIGARIEIASQAPGDIAKKSGLKTIYFADIRIQSYLLGLWKKRTVEVYGE